MNNAYQSSSRYEPPRATVKFIAKLPRRRNYLAKTALNSVGRQKKKLIRDLSSGEKLPVMHIQ
jgi:hypothetical protein